MIVYIHNTNSNNDRWINGIMAKINPSIIYSMTKDLRDLHEIGQKIMKDIGPYEIVSWRYPDRSSKDIKIVVETDFFDTGDYVLLLELIIDRLYLILSMSLHILSSSPELSNSSLDTLPKNITKPSNGISFGTTVSFFWKRLQILTNINSQSTENNLLVHNSNMKIENNSKISCKNCSVSFSILKTLIKNIEECMITLKLNSQTKECRENNKKYIAKLSQSQSMKQWVQVLVLDARCLMDYAKKKLFENNKIKKEMAAIEKENETNKSKVYFLDKKFIDLENWIKQNDLQLESCRKTQNDLFLKCTHLTNVLNLTEKRHKEQQEDFLEIEKQIHDDIETRVESINLIKTKYSTQIQTINSEKDIWKNLYNDSQIKIEELTKDINEVKAKQILLDTTKKQNKILEDECSNAKGQNETLQLNIDQFKTREEEFILKICVLQQNVTKLNNELRDSKERETILLKCPDLNGPIACCNARNPYDDMVQQIEVNELRIGLLQKQNEKLQHVVNKMKHLPNVLSNVKT